jgi:16S rRNA (cytidine1402-2'-O)-methyltransferase
LENLGPFQATLVFYEAPHRILDTLEDIEETLGPRPVVIARELTKVHEEFLRGTAAELREALGKRPSVKGEITLMIGKSETTEVDETPLAEAVEKLVESGVPRMDALKTVARRRGLSKREVYKQLNQL